MKHLLIFWGIVGPITIGIFAMMTYSGQLDRERGRFMAQCDERYLAAKPSRGIYEDAARVEYCTRQWALR